MHFLFIYVIPFLLIITILVFVHEFGHYYYARKFGVKVDAFSIGMGPELFGFTDKNGTRWKFSAIPFGGYVLMHGDKDAASAPDEEEIAKMNKSERELTMFGKSPAQRIAISAAGPAANFAYSLIVFMLIYIFCGRPFSTNIINSVAKNSIASSLDIKAGDIITKINDTSVTKAQELVAVLSKVPLDSTVRISRLRDQSLDSFDVKIKDKRTLGISFAIAYENLGIFTAIYQAIVDVISMFFSILLLFLKLCTGAASMTNLGGPLSIANMLGNLTEVGDVAYILFFSAILGINLAALNLFPLPALDGGNIMFDTLEHFGVKVKMEYREKITGGFFILLLLFMAFATYNDIMRLNVVKNLLK